MRKNTYHSLMPIFECLAKSEEVKAIRARIGELLPEAMLIELKKLDEPVRVALALCLYDQNATLECNISTPSYQVLKKTTLLEDLFTRLPEIDSVGGITHLFGILDLMENPYVNIYEQGREEKSDLISISFRFIPKLRGVHKYYLLIEHLLNNIKDLNYQYKKTNLPTNTLVDRALFFCDIKIVALMMDRGFDFSQCKPPDPSLSSSKNSQEFWREFIALRMCRTNASLNTTPRANKPRL